MRPVIDEILFRLFEVRAADEQGAVLVELVISNIGAGLVRSRHCAVAGAIEAIDEVTRLLKLQLDEEGRRDADAPLMKASGVRAALCDLTRPISETALIRLTAEEIRVVLADEKLRSQSDWDRLLVAR